MRHLAVTEQSCLWTAAQQQAQHIQVYTLPGVSVSEAGNFMSFEVYYVILGPAQARLWLQSIWQSSHLCGKT